MKVGGQFHATTDLIPGKNAGTHRICGWVDLRTGMDVFRRDKSLTKITSTFRQLIFAVVNMTLGSPSGLSCCESVLHILALQG